MYYNVDISAIILASGKATRLGQECLGTPKCLLEFNGVPFLNYLINWVFGSGIKKVIVTACTNGHKIKEEIEKRWSNHDVKVAFEDVVVNTVASANAGLKMVETKHSFILTADTIWDVSLKKMMRFHLKKNANATILITKRNSVPNIGQIKVLKSDQVVGIWDGSSSLNSINDRHFDIKASTMGVYCVNVSKMLDSINLLEDSDIEREPLRRLLPDIWAFWCEGLFLDYGTPDKLDFLRKNPVLINKYFGRYNEK